MYPMKLLSNNKIGNELSVHIRKPNFKFKVKRFLWKKIEEPIASHFQKYEIMI